MSKRRDMGEGGALDAGGDRVTGDAFGAVSRATLCGCLSLYAGE